MLDILIQRCLTIKYHTLGTSDRERKVKGCLTHKIQNYGFLAKFLFSIFLFFLVIMLYEVDLYIVRVALIAVRVALQIIRVVYKIMSYSVSR